MKAEEKRISKALKARKWLRSPSIVEFTEQLELIQKNLQETALIYVKASPLSGRTTFLHQIGEKLEAATDVYFISISAPTDLTAFNKILQEELAIAPSASVLDSAVQKINETASILIIDNFDFIRENKITAEFLIKNVIEGKVILSGTKALAVDSTLVMDFKVHSFTGLNKAESEKLIQKSGVKFSTENQERLTEKLLEVSKGSAFILKTILSGPLMEARPITQADIDLSLPVIGDRYWNQIFDLFSETTLLNLQMASLLHYDDELRSRLILETGLENRHLLESCGVITKENEVLSIQKPVCDFIFNRFIEKIPEIKIQILKKLNDQSYKSLKDKLKLELDLKDFNAAIETATKIIPTMYQKGELTDVVELTNSIWMNSPVEVLVERRKALVLKNLIDQAHQEFESLLKSRPELTESDLFQFSRAKNFYSISKYDESLEILEMILQNTKKDDFIFIDSLLQKLSTLSHLNPNQAEEFILTIEPTIHLPPIAGTSLEGRFFFVRGLIANEQSQYDLALEYYNRAFQIYSSLGQEPEAETAFLASTNAQLDLGMIQQYLANYSKLKIIIDAHGSKWNADMAMDMEAFHQFFKGKFSDAKEIWQKLAFRSGPIPTTKSEVQFARGLVSSLWYLNKFNECAQLIQHLVRHPYVIKDFNLHLYYNFLKSILGFNQSTEPNLVLDLEKSILKSSLSDELKATCFSLLMKRKIDSTIPGVMSENILAELEKLRPSFGLKLITLALAFQLSEKLEINSNRLVGIRQTIEQMSHESGFTFWKEIAFENSLKSEQMKNSLILDLEKGILEFAGESKNLVDRPILLKLLGALIKKHPQRLGKEELIKCVWQENYNPLVHDARIYTSIKRLRAILNEIGLKDFVISRENEYAILPKDILVKIL